MRRYSVPYAATGRFQPVVVDYLERAAALEGTYQHRPDKAGIEHASAERMFDPAARAILCGALERQYADEAIPPAVRANLGLLRNGSTRVITTGHQLCLFTGPLYVPFKLLNVIRLARAFKTAERPVVPVFWMATEDHDRSEIDHAWVQGERVHWPGEAAGAVGRMPLEGIGPVVEHAGALLGQGAHGDELRAMLARCYRPEHDLAKATRLFVTELFGRFGLIVIDGDDPALKRLFAPLMQEELVNQVAQRTVRFANERLGDRYKAQAHAREINLFHLRPGHRSRIELHADRYEVIDGGPSWTLDTMLRALDEHPEAFSPNVLMRPLYQETVLPNIAYVGGGGELAYWLQLRWLHEAFRTPMPAVVLRTSAALLSAKDLRRCQELGLEPGHLFLPKHELETRVASRRATFSTSVEEERRRVFRIYEELAQRSRTADATLEQAVRGAAKRSLKGLDALEHKLVRAAKREQQEALQDLERVLDHLFPGGTLQERRENFMPWYAQQGPAFFDGLLEQLDPLTPTFSLLFAD